MSTAPKKPRGPARKAPVRVAAEGVGAAGRQAIELVFAAVAALPRARLHAISMYKPDPRRPGLELTVSVIHPVEAPEIPGHVRADLWDLVARVSASYPVDTAIIGYDPTVGAPPSLRFVCTVPEPGSIR